MAQVAERVGRGPCPHCGETVTFKRSSGKLLNFRCDACCSTGYSEPGGSAHSEWERAIKSDRPAAQPAPGTSAPKAPAPRAGKFDLEALT